MATKSPIATFVKDPDSTLDYGLDWSKWLGTDTISASTWTLDSGITSVTESNTTTTTTIFISGGTLGESYNMVNQITTANTTARIEHRTVRVVISER